jgi:glycosyltransferase involved in cell wall biosynthesis
MDDGGAERVMLQLGKSFAARGHEVDLVVAVPGGPLESQVPASLRRIDLRAKRSIQGLPPLARYLRREKPRALLSTLEHSNLLAVWARYLSLSGVRVVLREANVILPDVRGWKARVERLLMRGFYRAASAIVAVSESVADSLVNGLGLSRALIRTIYNPVVTDDIAQKASAPLEDPWFTGPLILGVGRLVAQKDFATLIRAFALVKKTRPAKLAILGEGADRPALEALARELQVESDVRLYGYDHNPFRYMQRSTVFALSSIFEGLPGALIQAMACGCRVISTDCPGGSREILSGQGPLVPMRDPRALAGGINTLLDDAEKNPGRARYDIRRFTEEAAVEQYLEVML